tara:strand:+ start:3145 stop:4659 length:1515 start_codon:yes stop_codon:yes gene_type:complete
MRDYILLYVNGKRYKVFRENVFITLSDFLRKDLGLVGTKVVCAEGDCGSCTVLLGRTKLKQNGDIEFKYQSIDSCIQYLFQLDCSHIITVEGLKNDGKKKFGSNINNIQSAIVESGGSQCGYCTPGFVMSLSAMLESKEKLTRNTIKEGLTGNLCRCTGYEQIIEAALSIDASRYESITKFFNSKSMLEDFKEVLAKSVYCKYYENWNGVKRKFQYFLPVSLEEALEFKQKNNNLTVVAGGTDISVQMNKARIEPNSVMSLNHLKELEQINVRNHTVTIGSRVTWTRLEEIFRKYIPEFYKIIRVFASKQIKNEGTLAGNIANASPIADSLPFLFVIDSELELSSTKKNIKTIEKRWLKINDFFNGYKKIDIKPGELITKIRFRIPESKDVLKLYKVSKRKDLDISTFTAGIIIRIKEGKIEKARIAYGGVGPVVLRLLKVEKFLKGKVMLASIFKEAGALACKEISPISDVRSSSDYRFNLAEKILQKFFYEWEEDKNNTRAA